MNTGTQWTLEHNVALFTTAKMWKLLKYTQNGYMNKQTVVHPQNEILFSLKRETSTDNAQYEWALKTV